MAGKPAVLSLTSESLKYLTYLEEKLGRDVIYKAIVKLFDREAKLGAGMVVKDFLIPRLRMRSNTLARNVTGQGKLYQGVPGARIGVFRSPALAYAGIQDLGTKDLNPESPYPVIKPKSAKALAMPVNEALNASGIPRYDSPRDAGKLHFIPFRRGIAVGALYTDKEWKKMARDRKRARKRPGMMISLSLRNYKALYILLKKTSIKPTFWLRDGFQAFLDRLAVALADYLSLVMKGTEVKGG